jgi:hypothetical protein
MESKKGFNVPPSTAQIQILLARRCSNQPKAASTSTFFFSQLGGVCKVPVQRAWQFRSFRVHRAHFEPPAAYP